MKPRAGYYYNIVVVKPESITHVQISESAKGASSVTTGGITEEKI